MSGLSTGTSQPAVGGSTLALALDMGCYEILTPSDPAYPGHVNSSASSTEGALSPGGKRRGGVCVQLWTRELGERLVQQYQQYIQQQLSRQGALDLQDELGRDNSFEDEAAPYMLHGRLGALQEHHQPLQQQHPHLGLGGLRQLSVGRSSSRALGGVTGGHVADYGDRQQLGASRRLQQQQQHSPPHAGMVGRSASMTVPHSWQQMTSSLFGVGVMHPESDSDG